MKRFVTFMVVSLVVVLAKTAAQPRAVAKLACVDVDINGLYWYMNDLNLNKGVPLANMQIISKQPVDGGYYRICWVQ